MADRTTKELLQAPTEGYGEAIVVPKILAENFEIKTNLLQLVQINKFHGFEMDNPHTNIINFKRMTSTLKYTDVPNDSVKLMLFSYSLKGAARIWYEKEPPNSILTWDDLINKFVNQFFPSSKTTQLKNETSRFTQRFEETFGEAWERFKEMLRAFPHHGFSKLTQIDTIYNGLSEKDQDSLNAMEGGNLLSKTTREASKIIENKSKIRYSRCKSNVSRVNTNSRESSSKTDDRIDMLADQISNLVEIVNKQVITPATVKAVEKSCVIHGGAHAYYDCIATDSNQSSVCAATVTTRSGLAYEGPSIEETTDNEQPNCQGSTAHIQPLKLPKKLGDPDKFLIPCDFMGMDVCHALADLGASINLMPLSIWKKLSISELTPTRMTLELANRSITHPKGVVEYVFVKVGKFHFPTDFVVIDFIADPQVPLIRGRSFLRIGRALIDVYGEEITLRVNEESITFNLNQTMRYSSTYDENSVNRIDIISIACEECAQDVLDFKYNSKSGNPTLVSNPSLSKETKSEFCKEPMVKSSSPTPTPFGEKGDILYLEKFLNDDPSQLPLMDLKQVEETKAKSLIEEPLELELKELPSHLEYAFLEQNNKLPVIIAKDLKDDEKEALLKEDYKRAVQSQRRVNPKIHEVIKKEVIKLLDVGMIYPISDSLWVSPVHCVPKKGGMTIVANENNELIPTRLVTSWRVCIDYRKLNDATRKDHFLLPFMDQMLERLAKNEFYYVLDGFSGYFQIPIDPQDQEKTTFTCPYGTFAYRRMPFGLCNAPGTFQRCMLAIFHDMIEKTMEVFMDDFSVFGDSFSSCLSNLDKMLKRCEDTNLVLNWEMCHFMCKEGIVLGHKISKSGIEVDRAKVDVMAKLPHPTTVKGVRSFLGHTGVYRRFIQDFSKIARPMTHLLEKETPFVFSKDCIDAFETLKKKLTEDPILVVPDWNLPFELMCNASDFAIGAVLGQRKTKHF
nr:reverse transcriptase domain-containing protein [Tanacetum cinerariifolium]